MIHSNLSIDRLEEKKIFFQTWKRLSTIPVVMILGEKKKGGRGVLKVMKEENGDGKE